jgi:ubiquinone biosynthesis accessory factor UbiK
MKVDQERHFAPCWCTQPLLPVARFADTLGFWRETMITQKILDEIGTRINQVLETSPAKDVEKNVRAMLQSFFSRMDLVSREEFDVQTEVLLRTREKLVLLENRLAELESRMGHGENTGAAPATTEGNNFTAAAAPGMEDMA